MGQHAATLDRETVRQAAKAVGLDHLAESVSLEVGAGDIMFEPTAQGHYAEAGAGGLAAISRMFQIHRAEPPRRILDFGCGHGRVMRWMRAAWPDAEITGADVGEAGVQFCRETFGSKPAVCGIDFQKMGPFPGQDLIWAGSVFTHLRESDARLLFRDFIDWLAPGGVAMLSTHGRLVSRNMAWGSIDYTHGLGHDGLLRDYAAGRFAYTAYRETPTYGVSLVPREWWMAEIGDRADVRLSYVEQGWVHHHDIVAVQRFV